MIRRMRQSNRRALTPGIDQLESRQMLSTVIIPVFGPGPVHRRPPLTHTGVVGQVQAGQQVASAQPAVSGVGRAGGGRGTRLLTCAESHDLEIQPERDRENRRQRHLGRRQRSAVQLRRRCDAGRAFQRYELDHRCHTQPRAKRLHAQWRGRRCHQQCLGHRQHCLQR